MILREAVFADLDAVMGLYAQLHPDEPDPLPRDRLEGLWGDILADPNHHVILACAEEAVAASCVLLIVPNLTRGQRPWGIIENMITGVQYRKQGYGGAVLAQAVCVAREANCYKLMLATGQSDPAVHRLYRNAGFNSSDKTAYVQWFS